jgi:nucleoside 2-deoxyribosyltransferase
LPAKKVYVSGALTKLDSGRDYREIYEAIGRVCAEFGYEPYIPHQHCDPIRNPEIDASVVWQKDHSEIEKADLTLAYVGQPSLGVGAEIEIARILEKDLIIWYFEAEKVSRMALGNPAVRSVIIAKDETDLYGKIKAALS